MPLHIYTDGGARPNPGPGGWAAVIVEPESGEIRELSGGDPATTNNRMELMAAIASLEAQPDGAELVVWTDSLYLRRGITEWLPRWVARGWKRGDGEIKNRDLWQRLASAAARHRVEWRWLKGHAGDANNERADQLATAEIERLAAKSSSPIAELEDPVVEQATADATGYFKTRLAGGRGVWVALLVRDDDQQQLEGRRTPTSAPRLELEAGLALLRRCSPETVLELHAPDYLRRGATEWLAGWKRAGWMTGAGEPVRNLDLWRQLDRELGPRRVLWQPPPRSGPIAEELSRRLSELWKR